MKRKFEVDEESGMITMTVDGESYGFIDPHTCPSYFTYKPRILKFVLCYNYNEMCVECREPECDGKGISGMVDSIPDHLKKARAIALVGYFLIEGHRDDSIEKLMENLREIKGEE